MHRDPCCPSVSFVLATHNRRDVVLHTLSRISENGLNRNDYEVVVVDNASHDGTPEAIAPFCDELIRLDRNAGSCAKAHGVEIARGRYVVFLDDDSFPQPGSVRRMMEHFEHDPQLAAAGFDVHLPDGRREGAALPHVFVGCGAGFRRDALLACGNLDATFFMQAEEYELTFRLASGGWRVRTFDDLHVTHLKTPTSRRTERTTFLDTRNNLRVIARCLTGEALTEYRADCLQRYQWLAERDGHLRSFTRGAWAGLFRGSKERWAFRHRRLAHAVFESFFEWESLEKAMTSLAADGAKCVALADLGKNAYAFYRAAVNVGLEICAIGDDRFAGPGRTYRGIPVVTLQQAIAEAPDAVVVANSAPVHGLTTYRRVQGLTALPVYRFPRGEAGTQKPVAKKTKFHAEGDIAGGVRAVAN